MIARVLVIDDDAPVRRMLATMLGRGGFDVSTASDGALAIQLIDVEKPELVIVDYNMPTNGIVVVRALRARYGRALYIAVLTGAGDEVRDACLVAGADAVFVKPVASAVLRRRLTAAAAALRAA